MANPRGRDRTGLSEPASGGDVADPEVPSSIGLPASVLLESGGTGAGPVLPGSCHRRPVRGAVEPAGARAARHAAPGRTSAVE